MGRNSKRRVAKFGSAKHVRACRIHSRMRLWQRYGIPSIQAQDALYNYHSRLISGREAEVLEDKGDVVLYRVEHAVKGFMYPVYHPTIEVLCSYLSPEMVEDPKQMESWHERV